MLRGLVFLGAGVFLITQFVFGENPGAIVIWISWASAAFAFGATLLFIWAMRQKE
jgi:hypothetical protein